MQHTANHAEYVNDLPDAFYDDLEDGEFGVRFLRNLERRFDERFPRGSST